MKCQILFSEKNKASISVSSAEFFTSTLSVNAWKNYIRFHVVFYSGVINQMANKSE